MPKIPNDQEPEQMTERFRSIWIQLKSLNPDQKIQKLILEGEKQFQRIGNDFYLPIPDQYRCDLDQGIIGKHRMVVVIPDSFSMERDPVEAETALILQAPEIPCGIQYAE